MPSLNSVDDFLIDCAKFKPTMLLRNSAGTVLDFAGECPPDEVTDIVRERLTHVHILGSRILVPTKRVMPMGEDRGLKAQRIFEEQFEQCLEVLAGHAA